MNPYPHLSIPYISYVSTVAIVFGVVGSVLHVTNPPAILWFATGVVITIAADEVVRPFERWERSRSESKGKNAQNDEIEHSRECSECGATTYTFERCHVCGDVPWKDGDQA